MNRATLTRIAPWIVVFVAAIALGVYAEPPFVPGMPPGRMYQRIPSTLPAMPELLFTLGVGSVIWYAAILSIPVLLMLARRAESRARLIGGGALAFMVLFAATAYLTFVVEYRGAPGKPPLIPYFGVALRQQLLPWILVMALVFAIEMRRRSRKSRLEIAEQRLIALTGQLQPHFLFNTLQSISTLIHRDPNAADEMLAKLSDLLRDLLKHRDSPLVPLKDELQYTRTYLEISKVRFADRLSFSIESDPQVQSAKVPLFILQPIVENAINHGIGSQADGGTIAVRARKHDDKLELEVADNGRGMSSTSNGNGVGLANTKERLAATFGSNQRFTIDSNPAGGVSARIEIPIT